MPLTRRSVDTNLLIRSVEPASPSHAVAVRAITVLQGQGDILCIMPQNAREFWNVATRPVSKNGLGLSLVEADATLRQIEADFLLLEDGLPVYREWRRLVFQHQVSGVQVHNCYLAAAMNVHGITDILTFNGADFVRYGVNPIDPATI